MIKAAFDEGKINKQARSRAGLYLLAGAGAARPPRPGATSNGGAAPGRGDRGLSSDGFFLVPTRPGRSAGPLLIAGPRPVPAGAAGAATCRPEGHTGRGAVWRCRLARSPRRLVGLAFPNLHS